MIVKVMYPYKNSISSIELREIYLKTDEETYNHLKNFTNPIELGQFVSDNEDKIEIVPKTTPDKTIEIEEVLANPDLVLNLL